MRTLADYKGAVQSFRLASNAATNMAAKIEWEKTAEYAEEKVRQIEQRVFQISRTKGD